MDYERFIQELPNYYENWGEVSVKPKTEQFQSALEVVPGMTTSNVTQLLNFAVACMETDEVYCEIGCFRGATLVGALLSNANKMAYAVDNFSEFDPDGENLAQLEANLKAFGLYEQVCFCEQNFEEFFFFLRETEVSDRFGVYFYDGAHDYRSQLLGLLLAKPFLADKALIIVDDTNALSARQANWDFMASHPQCNLLLDIVTPGNSSPTFWNGVQIMSWDASRTYNYGWETFQKLREPLLIEGIYELQFVVEKHKQRMSQTSEE